ncbi:hypothetical protein HZH68_000314 [Vespula germanica]|uniref:Uncharacterized protein n=1 Tax=Vespula germanica TaxID=30212 RepID=A0A834U5Q8_VESGE|nr:hypothetical protein HZH68_000314 [Vespula germanica]
MVMDIGRWLTTSSFIGYRIPGRLSIAVRRTKDLLLKEIRGEKEKEKEEVVVEEEEVEEEEGEEDLGPAGSEL